MGKSRIDGITIQIGGDTQQLTSALASVNKSIRDTQSQLRDVDRLLKLDPTNVELIRQKQQLLSSAITDAESKLEQEKEALRQLESAGDSDKTAAQQDALKREIIATTQQIDKYESDLASMASESRQAGAASDQLASDLDNAGNSAKGAGGGFTVLKGIIANIGASALMAIGNGLKDLAKGAIDYQTSLEGYETSFATMTGSADKAASVVENLGNIAASTPFELPQLADTTQLLMNYGFTADDAMDKMTMLGDISQGSADKMTRIATAYGQMSSAGKVSLEDVKQMIEAGFNPLQEISQTTGESMESLYGRISAGTLSIDEITASMERSTAEGGKYFGAMDAQSQTLTGRMSTLSDTVNATIGGVMAPALADLADNVLPNLTESISGMSTAFETGGFAGFGEALGGVFSTILQTVSSALPQITEALTGFVGGALTSIASNFGEITSTGIQVVSCLLTGITKQLPTLIPAIIQGITGMLQAIATQLPTILTQGVQLISQLVQGLRDGLPQIIAAVPEIILSLVTGLLEQLPTILQEGINIVTAIQDGIIQAIPALVEQLPTLIQGICDGIAQNLPMIIESGVQLTLQLAMGLIKALPTLIGCIPQIVSAIVTGLASLASSLIEAGAQLLKDLWGGFSGWVTNFSSNVAGFAGNILGWITGALGDIASIGSDIVEGIWEGISNGYEWIKEKVSGWVDNFLDYMKGLLGIASPSKVFAREVGYWIPAGIAAGIKKNASAVDTALADLVAVNDPAISASLTATPASVTAGQQMGGIASTLARMLSQSDTVDSGLIYEAVKAGASDATINLYIGDRDMTRKLNELGVAFA